MKQGTPSNRKSFPRISTVLASVLGSRLRSRRFKNLLSRLLSKTHGAEGIRSACVKVSSDPSHAYSVNRDNNLNKQDRGSLAIE
jgi:hypothetical protein